MLLAIIPTAKEAREASALTLTALAYKSDTSIATIQSIEAQTPVKFTTAIKVAEILKIPIDQITTLES